MQASFTSVICWGIEALFFTVFLASAPASAQEEKKAVPADHPERMRQGLVLFKEHVRPALVQHCLMCHGGKTTKGKFDLSDRGPLEKSGAIDGGGKESRLYALITHAEEPHMPQKGPKLSTATADQIARWIDLGAPYDAPLVERPAAAAARSPVLDRDFWSFRPLQDPKPPSVQNAEWIRTPVDRFILAELEAHGLAPAAPADRRTLIRRVYFDLIGLPPTPDEVDAFVADPDPSAYLRLVDRLLASPHYGERWARHWMDVARFAESHGYEQDYDRTHAYHYRDFLIRALNRDMPYTQFAAWQVAGDELAPADPMALAATGFLGAGAFPTQLTEAEFESARYNELDDVVSTIGTAFLGLSVGCARCHDHKYDPIPSDDYYRLAATFTTTIRSEIDVPLGPGSKPVKMQVTSEGFPHTKHHADDRGFPHFYKETYILRRGDVNQKAGEATPDVLRVLNRGGRNMSFWKVETPEGWSRTSFRRAALTRWLVDTEAGAGQLIARVAANRVWQHHFGRGIVATPNDFGAQGAAPTHPALLEWLASELVARGWHLKALHRVIVTSAVYQQSDQFQTTHEAIDPDNAYYWRYTPWRLEAEPIRDTMLAIAGLLDQRMYGPGSLDPGMSRRGVYFFIKRSQLVPMMMLYDWPEHLVSIGQRSQTTTAPQALVFMNSPLGRRCATGLADRLAFLPSEAAIRHGYRFVLGRQPTQDEARLSADFLAAQANGYAQAGRPDPNHLALVDFAQALLSTNEVIYVP
jgi:mono/diheme cytochrome c family protein